MWKNLKQKTYHQKVIAAQTVTADVNSASVNCKDINSLGFLVAVEAFAFDATNKVALKLQESDDDSVWSDVTDVYEGTAPNPIVLDTVVEGNKSHLVEYRGGKQYARLVLDVSGTVSVAMAAIAISNKPELMPPQ
jgi:hypothetical protein